MSIGAASYYSGFLAFLLLVILLFVSWRGRAGGRRLILASGMTAAWCAILGLQEQFHGFPVRVIWTAEILRTYVWLAFLGGLLGTAKEPAGKIGFENPDTIRWGIRAAALLQLLYVWFDTDLARLFPGIFRPAYQSIGYIVLALIGLVLVEQFFRNTRIDLRWRIKFLCFALGAMFAYDFYLYSDALLFHRIHENLWSARGAVSILLTPLLAVSAARNADWSVDIFVSRQVVFHSATLLGSGIYLLVMAGAGYYIRRFGGEWGALLQIVFLVGAFLVLALLMFSGQMRAHIRVFLSKHFFNYLYDYRQEWLRIIHTLSDTRSTLRLEERIILALGQAVESPSGVLWSRGGDGDFMMRASFGEPRIDLPRLSAQDPAIACMEQREWILNLREMIRMPEAYEGLRPPEWLRPYANAWLLIPLLQQEKRMDAVLLLTMPRTAIHWNWEVIDLLKTSSRLAASYLALEDAGRALAEARQFEGFNRLSAFVIHDLKNLVAQLSLVVRNAERHRDNPEFMADAIETVDHAVGKMSRLLAQLRNLGSGQSATNIELCALLNEVLSARKIQPPIPQREGNSPPILLRANRDRLASALEHVIHNAQDAAGKHGRVVVRCHAGDNGCAIVEVEDNGHGMDAEFIRTRLFKPFDTTKGLTGMGIGAYESREYIRSLGGDLVVESEPNRGTLFRFFIPMADTEAGGLPGTVQSA